MLWIPSLGWQEMWGGGEIGASLYTWEYLSYILIQDNLDLTLLPYTVPRDLSGVSSEHNWVSVTPKKKALETWKIED